MNRGWVEEEPAFLNLYLNLTSVACFTHCEFGTAEYNAFWQSSSYVNAFIEFCVTF